ncbi:hypothetical protein GCM10027596_16130 [Nocardioides korecus]
MPRGIPRGRSTGKHTLSPAARRSAAEQSSATAGPRRTALVVAPLATLAVIGVGVLTSGAAAPASPTSDDAAVSAASATVALDGAAIARPVSREPRILGADATVPSSPEDARAPGISRSTDRVPLVDSRVPQREGTRWSTAPLKLRGAPTDRARVRGVLPASRKVVLSGRRSGSFTEIVTGPTATRWVSSTYLARTKPVPPKPRVKPATTTAAASSARTAPAGLSSAPCPDGSAIESALQPQAVKVYRAVCAAFPELSSYGGQDGHGEHVNGEAIDFMVPSSSVGERVKDFVYAHHTELGLFDIIWSQHIWTIQRASEGFRPMPDRGSATANHFDHVHIKIN